MFLDYAVAELTSLLDAFGHDDFAFELKHDGFRSLAYITPEHCRLVSRKSTTYRAFPDLTESLCSLGRSVVLDGEIVNLNGDGRSQFYDTMRRGTGAVFTMCSDAIVAMSPRYGTSSARATRKHETPAWALFPALLPSASTSHERYCRVWRGASLLARIARSFECRRIFATHFISC